MATIYIRNIDDALKSRLRSQAAQNGRSMAEEARVLLRLALSSSQRRPGDLAELIRGKFAPLGGVDLTSIAREPIRDERFAHVPVTRRR